MYWTITKGLEAAAMIVDRTGHIPWLYFQTRNGKQSSRYCVRQLAKKLPQSGFHYREKHLISDRLTENLTETGAAARRAFFEVE